jgi:hypothetical protein
MEAWVVVASLVVAAIAVCGFLMFKQMQSEDLKEGDRPNTPKQG